MVYILYAILCYEVIGILLWFNNDYKVPPGTSGIGTGEFVGFELFFFFIVTFILWGYYINKCII